MDDSAIEINATEIMHKHAIWTTGESSDKSSAATRREAINEYTENRGIERKAFAQFRAGLKIKDETKRRDWLRSLQLLLPVAEAEIFGNEPEMDFEGDDDEAFDAETKAFDDAAADYYSAPDDTFEGASVQPIDFASRTAKT